MPGAISIVRAVYAHFHLKHLAQSFAQSRCLIEGYAVLCTESASAAGKDWFLWSPHDLCTVESQLLTYSLFYVWIGGRPSRAVDKN